MKKSIAIIFLVTLCVCAVIFWSRLHKEMQSITQCHTAITCEDADGATTCNMDMDCDCTATYDGRAFSATYKNKMVTDHKPTDEENDCSSWCSSICSEKAKEYFNGNNADESVK